MADIQSVKDANQRIEMTHPVLLVQHNVQEKIPAGKLCTSSKQKNKRETRSHGSKYLSRVSKMDNY
jgi:hypothetical protein